MDATLPGDDVAALLTRYPSPVAALTPVSPLASPQWTRAAFRVAFADGAVWKVRRFESEESARRFVDLTRQLPAGPFPSLLAHEGQAVALEWIDGVVLAPGSAGAPDLLRPIGAILRSVHDVPVSDTGPRDRVYPGSTWHEEFAARIDRLCGGGTLTPADGAHARELVVSHAPEPSPVGLVLGDLAPENVVVNDRGGAHIVDTDGLELHAPAFDLARLWYRWPMRDQRWRAFEEGYASPERLAAFRAHFLHWAIVILVGAAAFRLRYGLPDAGAPAARLRDLLP
jgi:aminoglycoside phosphotransferase (APT) family kinase protein